MKISTRRLERAGTPSSVSTRGSDSPKAESKLNRTKRNAATRVYRGIILLLFMIALAVSIGVAVNWVSDTLYYGVYLEIFLIAYLIPLRLIWEHARTVSSHLKQNHPNKAKALLFSLHQSDGQKLDEHTIIRLSIEYMMGSLPTKILAPIIAYLLGGLAGMLALSVLTLLSSTIGFRSQRYFAFGWASANTHTLLQFIPTRLSGCLICIASLFIPKCRPLKALITYIRDGGKISTASGWPIAASAGALGITLGGPRHVAGAVVQDSWVGTGSAKTRNRDLRRASWLYIATNLIVMLGLSAALMLQQ